jgi:hypothetical protein
MKTLAVVLVLAAAIAPPRFKASARDTFAAALCSSRSGSVLTDKLTTIRKDRRYQWRRFAADCDVTVVLRGLTPIVTGDGGFDLWPTAATP